MHPPSPGLFSPHIKQHGEAKSRNIIKTGWNKIRTLVQNGPGAEREEFQETSRRNRQNVSVSQQILFPTGFLQL